MVINDSKKFIFIHVYKNGGCSMEAALGGRTKVPGIAKCMHLSLSNLPDHPNRKDYFSFAFVRNPWDRAVSSFTYKNRKNDSSKRTIDAFRSKVKLSTKPHKRYAQHDMVHNCSFIGRFEHIQEDFDTICNIVGIPKMILPHKNASRHELYTKFYTDLQKEIIYENTSGDIDHFGFTFEGAATKNVGDMR
jgi:hypothetical protein